MDDSKHESLTKTPGVTINQQEQDFPEPQLSDPSPQILGEMGTKDNVGMDSKEEVRMQRIICSQVIVGWKITTIKPILNFALCLSNIR